MDDETPEYPDEHKQPSKEELEEMFRKGQLKRGPKLRIYGIVYDEFKPSFYGPPKNFLTEIRIYEIISPTLESQGFYAQAIITTCQKTADGLEPVDTIYPIKIDLDNQQFIVIEKVDGSKMEHNLKDRLRVENISKMIDLTIAKITQMPEEEVQFVELGDNADADDADWWKQGKDDPEWWKKGVSAQDSDLPATEQKPEQPKPKLSREDFGEIPDGI